MKYEEHSSLQLLMPELVINVCGWVLIISGIAGLYYLIVGA